MADINCNTCKNYELDIRNLPCCNCLDFNKWEAIPLPPTTATEGEAKELVQLLDNKTAKQCAIIHCKLMMKRLPSEITHYQNLINQIESL